MCSQIDLLLNSSAFQTVGIVDTIMIYIYIKLYQKIMLKQKDLLLDSFLIRIGELSKIYYQMMQQMNN